MLWLRDKVSRFRADLITEIAYFGVLSYLVFVAIWRWVSYDPLPVRTDWRQVGLNLVAIVFLVLLWVRIKKMNEELAKAIEEEIRLRELKRRRRVSVTEDGLSNITGFLKPAPFPDARSGIP